MPRTSADGRHRGIVRAVCIAMLTVAYMGAVGGEMPVYNDTTQDMLLARDGVAFGTFAGGSTTTFPGIRMGELWVRILAFTFALGLGPVTQQAIAMVLAGLSIALFDRAIRRYFGDDIGWAPVAVLLPLMLVSIFYPIATQGYLGAPALVSSTLALLYVTTSGSTLAACVAGASLAFGAELHPVMLLGVPVFVVTVAMSCRQPALALPLAIASGIAAALAMSFHGWIGNAQTHPSQRLVRAAGGERAGGRARDRRVRTAPVAGTRSPAPLFRSDGRGCGQRRGRNGDGIASSCSERS